MGIVSATTWKMSLKTRGSTKILFFLKSAFLYSPPHDWSALTVTGKALVCTPALPIVQGRWNLLPLQRKKPPALLLAVIIWSEVQWETQLGLGTVAQRGVPVFLSHWLGREESFWGTAVVYHKGRFVQAWEGKCTGTEWMMSKVYTKQKRTRSEENRKALA